MNVLSVLDPVHQPFSSGEGCEVAEPRATGYREPPPCESCADLRGKLIVAESDYSRMRDRERAAQVELVDLRRTRFFKDLVTGPWKALVFAGGVGAIVAMVKIQVSRNEIEAADARAVKAAVAAVEAAKPPAPCADALYAVNKWSSPAVFICDPRAVASVEGNIGRCTCVREKP